MQVEKDRRYRPFPIRLLNKCGPLFKSLGLIPEKFDRDKLLKKAQKLTGLSDFGGDDFIEALDKLLQSLEAEARLNTIGQLSMHTYLVQMLGYRLRLEADRKKYPHISQQEIKNPLFIIGLPRTGSTILFELLALDPVFQSPLTWEIMYPTFRPHSHIRDKINQFKAFVSVAFVQAIAPEYKKIHEIGGFLPQECIAIQSYAFQSIQFHTTNRLNSYQAWLEESDWSPAYRLHKKFLQHFQAVGEERRWLLKAPGHLYSLDSLFKAYPDAHIIQTHRDPTQVIPSITSLSVTLRQAFSDYIDPVEVGEFSATSWQQALSASLNWRREHPEKEAQFLDILYNDFTHSRLGVVRQIYQFLGRELSPKLESTMKSYLRAKPQHKHGGHSYTLEEYGLSEVKEKDRFSDYLKIMQAMDSANS